MIKNAGRTGNDHEKGGRMKSEDTSLTTEIIKVEEIDKFLVTEVFEPIDGRDIEIKKEEIELAPFIPVTETLLRTAAGEIGTEAEQKEAQRLLAKMIAGPIGKAEF